MNLKVQLPKKLPNIHFTKKKGSHFMLCGTDWRIRGRLCLKGKRQQQ